MMPFFIVHYPPVVNINGSLAITPRHLRSCTHPFLPTSTTEVRTDHTLRGSFGSAMKGLDSTELLAKVHIFRARSDLKQHAPLGAEVDTRLLPVL